MIVDRIYAELRRSEFWAFLGQVLVESIGLPVPDEAKAWGWVYILFRVLSRVVKYIFPNPASPNGGWFKSDS